MKIAIAVDSQYRKVSGHAGRSRHWLLYDAGPDSTSAEPQRIELPSNMVFHHYEYDGPHPLDSIDTMIAISAGDGFMNKMKKRGVDARLTAETDPRKAVADYLAECLSDPKPRPIGSLICKAFDLFSKHK